MATSDRSIEPWPLHYVQTALWFLSATPAEKAKYLPPAFPAVKFHGGEGDFVTGNPLYFMVAFCADACQVGAGIDEWMDLDPSGKIRDQFNELRAVLNAMIWGELEKRNAAEFLRAPSHWPDMAGLFNAASRYSKEIIAELTWGAELSSPKLTCEGLLDEYSYGAYSAPNAD
jgi:hypothetical protein